MYLTIFTPTYNRAYTLPRLYKSLCKQTSKDFCWLIVDDGSTDNTEQLVKSFIDEKLNNIEYYKQKNSGKHIAHNKGIELCNSELFVCVDSDDWLTENAVEIILEKYNLEMSNNILGMYFRKTFEDGEKLATEYPDGVHYVGIEDLYHKYHFTGETVIVLKTLLVKNILFPQFVGEKFLSERIWYNMINHIAPMALYEDGIYCCEYLPDGLTRNIEKIMDNNPYGLALDFLMEYKYGSEFKYKLKNLVKYYAHSDYYHLNSSKFSDFYKINIIYLIPAKILSKVYIKLRLKKQNE